MPNLSEGVQSGDTVPIPLRQSFECQFNISHLNVSQIRGMAGKFVDTISIFNRKRNSIKMNISGFAKIFHEQIDEIL